MSWVLMAIGPAGRSIQAASADILTFIKEHGADEVFTFPTETDAVGAYLWQGALDADLMEFYGESKLLDWNDVQQWLAKNGEEC